MGQRCPVSNNAYSERTRTTVSAPAASGLTSTAAHTPAVAACALLRDARAVDGARDRARIAVVPNDAAKEYMDCAESLVWRVCANEHTNTHTPSCRSQNPVVVGVVGGFGIIVRTVCV